MSKKRVVLKRDDRRQTKRFPIRVLVNCLPPGTARKRNGHDGHGWEMWARDLGDDGVGLRWTREWAGRNYVPDFRAMDERNEHKNPMDPPRALLKKGCKVLLEGLVYNERGSKLMQGRVQWAHAAKDGNTYEFGIHITTPNHRSYFRALEK